MIGPSYKENERLISREGEREEKKKRQKSRQSTETTS